MINYAIALTNKNLKKKVIKIADLLKTHRELTDTNNIRVGERLGTPVEKGIVLNEDYLIRNQHNIEKIMNYFTAYPDLFLDIIKPVDEGFTLFFYQRIVLRAIMRYKQIYVTAPRGFAKSFLTVLAEVLECIFTPNSKRFICAPGKGQSAAIAKEKLYEIFQHWPLLRKEVIGGDVSECPGNYGKDYVTLNFRNGARFDVVAPLDSTRGGRRHSGLIDEVRDHEEAPLTEIVLPLLNISRRLPDNTVNPKEPNQQRIYMTSAGQKGTYAYELLLDVFEGSIINPEKNFCFGCDYRVPIMHRLLQPDYVNELRMSPSYSEESFAAEYGSIWRGGAKGSWYSYDKLAKYRKLKNPELHKINREGSKHFYILSVDVGRLHDQTVVCVFRVNPQAEKFYCTLVNIVVLGRTPETKPFSIQCRDLKKLIRDYDPMRVIIDGNGLGVGLTDELIKESYDEAGNYLPAYGFMDNDDYKLVQPRDAICILSMMKANGKLKSQINSNAYSMLLGGRVRFLIKEQEAKSALLATKIGQKMSSLQRIERLMPHELTTRLFEEMANLRVRQVGSDFVLEQINTRIPDDKYYSFAYGLWCIKEIEEEYYRRRRRGNTKRKLTFFSGGI